MPNNVIPLFDHSNFKKNLPEEPCTNDSKSFSEWCLGESVMRLLFENGNFTDILLDIFFQLDPKSLLSCALVCKEWSRFLQKHVFNLPYKGTKRITFNWIYANPKQIRTPLVKCNDNSFNLPNAIIPAALRPDVPRSVTANREFIVAAILGTIDLYDRRSGKHLKRVHRSFTNDLQWHMSMSSKYLIAKQLCENSGRLEVFDVKNNFNRIEMKERVPGPNNQSALIDLQMISDENLLIHQLQRGYNTIPSIECYWINNKDKVYEWMWRVEDHFSLYGVFGDRLLLCEKDLNNTRIRLKLHNVIDGKEKQTMTFETGEYDTIKGLAYTKPVGIVIVTKAERHLEDGWVSYRDGPNKIFLLDLAHGFVLRELNFDSAEYFGDMTNGTIRMWCDPPIGTLLMAAKGKLINSSKILAWNLLNLLRETDHGHEVRPDRVIETDGHAYSDAIAVFQHSLIYPSVLDNKVYMVDSDFWGKLKTTTS